LTRANATQRTIGGFFPLELTPVTPASSVLDLWSVNSDAALAFHNARSALHYILTAHRPARLWAPAFICSDAISAVPKGIPVSYYPLHADLSPDTSWLTARVTEGDCVLGVDYFGRPPASGFLDFVSHHKNILWIEDRAHALHPSSAPWGDWVVYSPRKLFGVPDGGIAIRNNAKANGVAQPRYDSISDTKFMAATLFQFEDTNGAGRGGGYRLFQESEAAMAVGMVKMSRLTWTLLSMIDPVEAMARRQANYDVLAACLTSFAIFSGTAASFAPLGFPIRHSDCDAVGARLQERGVFAARHWRVLPSPETEFPWEHDLSREIMTLPCDHRYDLDDMRFVAEVFLECAG
jgi:hypothetical protein